MSHRSVMRVWRAEATREGSHLYLAHFREHVLPELRPIAGFAGARVLVSDGAEPVQIVVETQWASMDAIAAFADKEDLTRAVIAPAARAVLLRLDEIVSHLEIAMEFTPSTTPAAP
ncbi:antibiotic biosynthesis monooxygenase [Pendulispora albinea]|uniref:ABM domain-containing protein n=1 Tax=Pendulispora albinea TaxID=2741071 RepID=A0ABZ2LT73_9BACT